MATLEAILERLVEAEATRSTLTDELVEIRKLLEEFLDQDEGEEEEPDDEPDEEQPDDDEEEELPESTRIIKVTASSDDGNKPENTLEGNLSTRWSAETRNVLEPQWIMYELANPINVTSLEMATFQGDQRKFFFEIEVSHDGNEWVMAYSRKNVGSSGTTLQPETYSFMDVGFTVRFLRIVGYGNSMITDGEQNMWNSITVVAIPNTVVDLEVATPPSNGNAGPDPFGIKQLYPTVAGGLTWDSRHWANGHAREVRDTDNDKRDSDDPTGFSRLAGNSKLVFRGDGVMSMETKDSNSSGPRLYIDPTRVGKGKFGNTEVTVYARLVRGSLAGNGGIVIGCRSGNAHGGGVPKVCHATTYYGRYLSGGAVNFYKELVHATYSDSRTTQGRGSSQGRIGSDWVGVKYIIRDAPRGRVNCQMYIDKTGGANGGTWIKVCEFTDTGSNWWSDDNQMSQCVQRGIRAGPRESVQCPKAGGVTLLRNTWRRGTNVRMDYKWMTVREVAPIT